MVGSDVPEPSALLLCDGATVPLIAFSALDALLAVGLGAAGFIVVALVCAAVLAVLQVVLPSTDSGATEVDRRHPLVDQPDDPRGGETGREPAGLDREAEA